MGRYQGGQAARESSLSRAWRPRREGSAATPSGVVGLSDLTYLGCCWVPKAKSGGGVLTGHYVGGELRLISLDPQGNGVEFTVPGMLSTDVTNAPRGVQTRATWVQPGKANYLVCQRSPVVDTSVLVAPGSSGAPATTCVTSGGVWQDGAVYVLYFDLYNTTQIADPNVLRVELGESGAWTGSGPWKVGPTLRNNGYLMALSGDLSVAAGGATWAIGAMGIQSGNIACSWGPSLFAGTGSLPGAGTPAYPGTAAIAAGTTLADFNYSHPCVRPATTNQAPDHNGGSALGGNGNGYWTQIDCSQSGTGCYLETATKAGFFYAGFIGEGCIWYSADDNRDGRITCDERDVILTPGHVISDDTENWVTGPHANSYRNYAWIFDPADYAKVARGQVSGWSIAPAAMGDLPGTPNFGTGANLQLTLRASWFDAVTDRLYLASSPQEWTWDTGPYQYRPIIHVFQVS